MASRHRPASIDPDAQRSTGRDSGGTSNFSTPREGTIPLGAINHSSLGYTAVVSDAHDMPVALVRKRGDTVRRL